MAVDAFLVITAVISSIIILVFVVMAVVYMQHPDDQNTAWLPKVIVVCGLYIACSNVLILPLDVINAQSGGGLDMTVLWQMSFFLTAIFVLIIIPFAYFFYENDVDPTADTRGCFGLIPYWNSQLCEGIKWSLAFGISFSLILLILYLILPWAYIPIIVRMYAWNSEGFNGSPSLRTADYYVPTNIYSQLDIQCSTNRLNYNDCYKFATTVEVQIEFPVYAMAVLSFLGWALFVIFGGMGLPALPWDLFNEWRFRPKPIDLSKYAEEKKKIGERAILLKRAGETIKDDELNNLGNRLSRKQQRDFQQTLHRFENAVFLLKKDYYHLQISYKKRGGNPIVYWVKLFISIVGASMSIMWIIHVCLFVLPTNPIDPFLNELFIGLSAPGFPLFGIITFSLYAFWLLACVIKGNFRFGLRLACCRVFPMEYQNTLMNSFLANTWLILLSSIVVVQFSAMCFPVYARNTQIDLLFGHQIRFLQIFSFFFGNRIFTWSFLGMVVISCCWLFLCPHNEAKRIENELNNIMKGKKKINKRSLELVSRQTDRIQTK